MAQPLYRQLLAQANRLARLDPRRPRQGHLRRAVSDAYYGLFHFLLDEASAFLVGAQRNRRRLRDILARAFAHGEMAAAARVFAGGTLPTGLAQSLGPLALPAPLRTLAEQFVVAQEQRHRADYDRSATFVRTAVLSFIRNIERAIADWRPVRKDPAGRFFLLSLLVWNRVRNI